MARLARPKSDAAQVVEAEQAAKKHKARIDALEAQEGIRGIEFSMTVESKHSRKGNTWIKMGGTIDPRDEELPEDARARLAAFVIAGLEEQIEEWLA